MENNSYIPLLKIYTSRLDPKGRCTFPSELRDGKKNIPVYLFYSPEFQRAIAVLDPDILQKRFPGNYHQIPLQKWDINDQGKLYLGESFFKFTDIPLATIKEVTFWGQEAITN